MACELPQAPPVNTILFMQVVTGGEYSTFLLPLVASLQLLSTRRKIMLRSRLSPGWVLSFHYGSKLPPVARTLRTPTSPSYLSLLSLEAMAPTTKRKTRADSHAEQHNKPGKPEVKKPEKKKVQTANARVKKPEVKKSEAKRPGSKRPQAKSAPIKKAKTEEPETLKAPTKKVKVEEQETRNTTAAKEPEPKTTGAIQSAELPMPPSVVARIIAHAARENISKASPARRIAAATITEYLVDDLKKLAEFERKRLPRTTESEDELLANCFPVGSGGQEHKAVWHGSFEPKDGYDVELPVALFDQRFTAGNAERLFFPDFSSGLIGKEVSIPPFIYDTPSPTTITLTASEPIFSADIPFSKLLRTAWPSCSPFVLRLDEERGRCNEFGVKAEE
ncbi:hypothetical protein HDK77DRAFT_504523 [Phyllosticta capitalensis]